MKLSFTKNPQNLIKSFFLCMQINSWKLYDFICSCYFRSSPLITQSNESILNNIFKKLFFDITKYEGTNKFYFYCFLYKKFEYRYSL